MAGARRATFGKVEGCECRDISPETIAHCIARGADSVVAIFAMNRCKLKCGDCVPAMRRAIARAAGTDQHIPAQKETDYGATGGRRDGEGEARALS